MSMQRGLLKLLLILSPFLLILAGAYLDFSHSGVFKQLFLISFIYLSIISIYIAIKPKFIWDVEEVLNLTTKTYLLAKGIRKEARFTRDYLSYVRLGAIVIAVGSLSFVLLIITNFSNMFLATTIVLSIISIGFAWYANIRLLEKQWLYIEVFFLIVYLLFIIYVAIRYGVFPIVGLFQG